MRLRLFFIASLLILSDVSFAQLRDNEYRNSSNPMYWQNRMPDKAYWQQDVQYKIDAKMNEDENKIEASEELNYWNNSPDTLYYVYFHLFQNAFIKGSYLHDLELANNVKPVIGKKHAAGLGIVVEGLTVDGKPAVTELDNTIMKVYLTTPLYPGAKVALKMNFTTYYDATSTRRRMKMYDAWGFMHYNGCQWFPKLCVYDRMHGWDTYQHLNKEFYGDFGLYDVRLDFPSNYIVEATGVLQNRKEALPDDLRAQIDIKNFANKKWDEKPSIIIPYVKGQRKVWHFVGNNVHDFAFTADPSYRIGTAYWNGVECVAIVQEPHAAHWQNAADYETKIIKTFSEDIGMYRYPKIVAADAQDGMEYPMITLDGGAEPGYRSLLTHEIGHNWFYGMVGSNETYRAAMDEGFTQFLTAYGLTKIDGENMVTGVPRSKYRRRFAEPLNVLDRNVENTYTMDELNGTELPLNTHSDDFHNALDHGGGYREVYFKTATMLYNLQYVLGDSLFKAGMHNYFEQWKFAHPYFEDFRASMIQFTHVDLSWFFDEWFETTKTLDYAIGGIHKNTGMDNFSINFRRLGEMQMPIDFTVMAKDGKKYSYYIPNTWFEKKTEAIKLPKWYGWGKLEPDYTAEVNVPSGIKYVQIDTTYRLADKDMLDNYKHGWHAMAPEAVKVKFDGGLNDPTDRRYYRLYLRPDLWWNPIDGIKAGLHAEGNYLNTLCKIDGTIWLNTHLLQEDQYKVQPGQGYYNIYSPINYTLNFLSPLSPNIPKLQVQVNSRYIDGMWYQRGGLNWLAGNDDVIKLYAQTMWRTDKNALNYLVYPDEWSSMAAHPNSSINAAWTHRYNYLNGNGRYTFSLRAPFLGGSQPFDYSYAQLEAVNYNYLGKLEVRTRLFGRYGAGNNIPSESALFMGGANPEELMDDKYTRSIGFMPNDWEGTSRYDVNHFQEGGGLNLRGYAGYFAPDERNGNVLEGYKGRSGASANLELGLTNYFPWHPAKLKNWLHADVYLFGDAGAMELSSYSLPDFSQATPTNMWSTLHVDAGAGFAFTIKNWGVFEKAKPLTLRIDFPVFLNRPPYNNTNYVAFRYVIGINRAF